MFFLTLLVLSVIGSINSAIAQSDLEGFQTYVTLPDVWAPRLNIKNHLRERVSPGYWFIAPYGRTLPTNPANGHQPLHTGPYIYDQDGGLIWAGTSLFDNINAYDFKAVHLDGQDPRLTLVLAESEEAPRGKAVILNQKYEIESEIPGPEDLEVFDFHEFKILPGGKTALACAHWAKEMTCGELGRPNEKSFFIVAGFYEFDIATGERLFWWDASAPGNIALNESAIFKNTTKPEESPGHDYLHINSVEKNDDGDYLISMRFTNTIYLISGTDGSIKWRLGGHSADFDQDFVFSKQHDARFLESNGTHHTISFLNNASDHQENSEDVSSILIVELDTSVSPQTARVVHRYNRPDNKLSRLRGNAQHLPNGNTFVSWSDNGYISEFSPEGDNLMEAEFMSTGFVNYRAYKYEFTGRPSQLPAIMASVTGSGEDDLTTTTYFSWNGATDVVSWNVYVQDEVSRPPYLIANIKKTGFETVHMAKGHLDWISVEPLDHNGTPLGRSEVSRPTWDVEGTKQTETQDSKPHMGHDVPGLADQIQPTRTSITFSSFVSILGFLSAIAVGVRLFRPWIWPRVHQCVSYIRQR